MHTSGSELVSLCILSRPGPESGRDPEIGTPMSLRDTSNHQIDQNNSGIWMHGYLMGGPQKAGPVMIQAT